MSEPTDHSLREDDLIAAEYALGVLAAAERAAAAQRIAAEPAFARMVAAWEERLAPWAAEIDEVAPAPAVWERIAAALPPPEPHAAPRPILRPSLWQSLAFWRGLTIASGALAAACLGILIYVGSYLGSVTAPPPLIAAIDGGGHHHFVATIDTAKGSIAVVPAAFAADATRVPELWLIPADGKPRPLGLLRADSAVTIRIPPALAPHATRNAVLAVSLEPPGGSPTGQPTGPVIATGKLTAL
jgi:anti-sigma-K factor RskA